MVSKSELSGFISEAMGEIAQGIAEARKSGVVCGGQVTVTFEIGFESGLGEAREITITQSLQEVAS